MYKQRIVVVQFEAICLEFLDMKMECAPREVVSEHSFNIQHTFLIGVQGVVRVRMKCENAQNACTC